MVGFPKVIVFVVFRIFFHIQNAVKSNASLKCIINGQFSFEKDTSLMDETFTEPAHLE